MVEMLVGMRKFGPEWTHRLQLCSKDAALTWVTSNEGDLETPNRQSNCPLAIPLCINIAVF
jgi:hypothetical protein